MIRLELPHIKYKKTYLEAVKEFQEQGEENISTEHYLKHNINELRKSFNLLVQEKIDNHNNIQKEGWVQSTEFWIIDDNDEYCGRISLRHRLNEFLSKFGGHIGYDIRPSKRKKSYASIALGLCLKEAKKIGLDKILITCDDDHIASIKIIEKNKGILQDKVQQDSGIITRRYWISLN